MSAAKTVDWTLYLVADVDYAAGKDLVSMVEEAIAGGVTAVQLRAKDLNTSDFLDLARRLLQTLRGSGVPLIINDRTEIALACGAAGVHLGQGDLSPDTARNLLGHSRIIGVSVNTLGEAREAERLGADYVGLGPAYATTTKRTDLPTLGPDGIRRIKSKIGIPVIAIGGISAGNAAEVMQAGADGVAVVSAILGAPDVRKAAAELKKAILV
jgi:thiamine-phosphate pyrophosphorylase